MTQRNTTDQAAANAQHAVIGVGQLSGKGSNPHPEAQWFAQPSLGLFVHWGISSVRGEVDLSWGMIKDKPWGGTSLSPADYWKQAEDFRPGHYQPERYLQAVKDAGFDYAVLTTKHHDGYLLWPAGHSEFGTATHMEGRDLVGPFVDACRKVGLKVGLYYSPPDWWFSREHLLFDYPGLKQSGQEPAGSIKGLGTAYEAKTCTPPDPAFVARRRDYLRSHIFELLERWGRIDLLWFDGRGVPQTERPVMEVEEIRPRQPWIVVNDRLTGSGDYVTYECRDADLAPQGWWEKCTQWNKGGWGYFKEEAYRSGRDVYSDYRQTREAGGNFLINAAPRPDGSMPEAFYRELEAFKKANL
jgi:alpha-L-fucosidase